MRLNIVVDGKPCDLLGTVIQSDYPKGIVPNALNEFILKQNTTALVVKNITVTVKSRNYELEDGQTVDYEVNM